MNDAERDAFTELIFRKIEEDIMSTSPFASSTTASTGPPSPPITAQDILRSMEAFLALHRTRRPATALAPTPGLARGLWNGIPVHVSPHATQSKRRRVHKQKRWDRTGRYHARIQKKWDKRFGHDSTPAAYVFKNFVSGDAESIFAHPAVMHGLRAHCIVIDEMER